MYQFTVPEGPFVLALVGLMFVVVFGFVLGIVYLEHRKEMALIETGQYPVETDSRAWVLAGGLLALAIGLGQVLTSMSAEGTVGPGLTLALVGVAGLVYYFLKRRQDRRGRANESAESGENGAGV